MNEVDARLTPPPLSNSPISMGKGPASFFGQQVDVYMALVTLHMHCENGNYTEF